MNIISCSVLQYTAHLLLIRLPSLLTATESPTVTVTAAKANAVSFYTSQTRTEY